MAGVSMMFGVSIRYRYEGDEAPWQAAVNAFIDSVNADDAMRGKFSYAVSVAGDGVTRNHVGRWDAEATVKTLQSRDYFAAFGKQIKEFAGESLDAKPVKLFRETN
jgi:hypothetical protein